MKYFFVLFFLVSCTSNTYQIDEIYDLVRKGNPTAKAIVSQDLSVSVIKCENYNPPCINAFMIEIEGMNAKFLQYKNEDDAAKAAASIHGFVVRNWALDDVTGEPILEKFVMKYLGARQLKGN